MNIIEMHADYINANYFRERERQRRLRGVFGGTDPDDVADDVSTTTSTNTSEDDDDDSQNGSTTSNAKKKAGRGKEGRGGRRGTTRACR